MGVFNFIVVGTGKSTNSAMRKEIKAALYQRLGHDLSRPFLSAEVMTSLPPLKGWLIDQS
jgi:hypothetical protein